MTSTDAPSTAVVIATHGRPDLLGRTLQELHRIGAATAVREVMVVENGPPHGAGELCASLRDRLPIRHLHVPEPGKTRALNRSVREIEAELIIYLDDDVRLDPRILTTYVDAGRRYGRGHYFGGYLKAEYEVEPPTWLVSYLPWTARRWDLGPEERFYDKPYFIGSNWAVFRKDVLDAGGYAEHIGPGSASNSMGDETELQMRLMARGCKAVYLPDARVRHHVPAADVTYAWVRKRHYRQGVTDVLIEEPNARPYTYRGTPLRLWRDTLVLGGKLVIARTLRWSDERRVYLEMTFAQRQGALAGRRLRRRFKRTVSPYVVIDDP